jgi:hypothetical protein
MRSKRKYVRAAFASQVVVTVDGKNHLAMSRDISLGGMFVSDIVDVAFGARVVVHVNVPGDLAEISLPAIVRWVDHEGIGLQFWLLGVRETHAITELLASNEPRVAAH